MAITVIGFFRKRSEAVNAVKQLTGSGFYPNNIDISYGNFSASGSSTGTDSAKVTEADFVVDSDIVRDTDFAKDSDFVTNPDVVKNSNQNSNHRAFDITEDDANIGDGYDGDGYDDIDNIDEKNINKELAYRDRNIKEHKGNAITRFFNSLFGYDSDDAKKYSTISYKADSIVTVHAGSRELAEEAANILDACGAMDIDEGSLVSETYADTIDLDPGREAIAPMATPNEKSGNLYPYAVKRPDDLEKTLDHKNQAEKEIRDAELTDGKISYLGPGYSDVDDSAGVGLTKEDLAAAGLNAEEIKAIEDISDSNLQNKVRTKSRIFDKQIDEDLRLRDEYEGY